MEHSIILLIPPLNPQNLFQHPNNQLKPPTPQKLLNPPTVNSLCLSKGEIHHTLIPK